jgi:hypothetical protein
LAKSKLVPRVPVGAIKGDPDLEKAEKQFDVILHLIGQVVVAWGEMDDTLIYVLARLSGSRPKAAGIMYYALDAFSTRLVVIRGLAQHKLKAGKKRADLIRLLDQIGKLGRTRNDIIHAVYRLIYDPKPNKWIIKKMVFRSARETLYKETLAQTGELENHLELLNSVRFGLRVFSDLVPRPRKSPRHWRLS